MVIQVGINGFGRIGRVIFRTCCEHPDLEIAAINDPAIELTYICYLIKFDSTHGKYKGNISYEGDEIKINGHSIKVFNQKAPSDIPWQNAGVQYVIEASGMFTTLDKASGHLASDGVRRVLVTAPSSDVPMLILGVNQERISADVKVISCTSSTLYCLAPIMKVLYDEFGVAEGFVTSIHAMTPSLKPLDGLCIHGKHWRDHRSIHQNIIPAATGACKALGRIIPGVRDKLAGLAFRVPIVNVSVLDLSVRLNRNTTMEEIIQCIEKFKDSTMRNIIQVSKEQAVSSDFIGDRHSCTLDVDSSLQLRPNFFKLICWYENEYSYACRVVDTILYSERQHPLIFTPLTKMTYVRPIFWKTHSEKTDITRKHVGVECVSNPKFSPYVSEANQIIRQNVWSEESDAFKACVDKYGRSSSVQNKINFHENSIAIKQIYQEERVKAQERLETVKSFSRMVNITEDLLRKSSSKKLVPVLANRSPSKEMTEKENPNGNSSELTLRILTKEPNLKENSNTHSPGAVKSTPKGITEKENPNSHSPRLTITSATKVTAANEYSNAHSPEMVIADNENSNTYLSGIKLRSHSKGVTKKESLNPHSSGLTVKSPSKEITEKEILNAHSSGLTVKSPSKEITEKVSLNAYSSGLAVKSPSKGIAEMESLNAHLSGLAVKSPSKGITEKESLNAHSSGLEVKGSSKGITENEKFNVHSSGLAVKSPSKVRTENSNIHLSVMPMRRPSTEITERQHSNACLEANYSSKEITENENLQSYLAAMANRSSLKEVTDIKDSISVKEDLSKKPTDFENCKEKNKSLSIETCGDIKSFNLSHMSNCTADKDSPNKSIDNNSSNQMPKSDSPIINKSEHVVGLNVLKNAHQTSENNNITLKPKNTVKTMNNISWSKLQQTNLSMIETQVSNRTNTLKENLSRDVKSSDFDSNCNFEDKHNAGGVIHIVSENPECVIRSSKLNEHDHSNINESKKISNGVTLNDPKTEDGEDVKLVTADQFNRALSKIEIVDEKLKQRNIVLVEYGVENTKLESNAFREDLYKEIPIGHQSTSYDSLNIIPEVKSMCGSPVNTITTASNVETNRSRQDIYDKLDSISTSGSENSFQIFEKKSQVINIKDLTYSLDDLDRLDKICRIIEISDELSDKLFAPLDERSGGETSQQKWSFRDLCKRIKLDEFCNNVFGKTTI